MRSVLIVTPEADTPSGEGITDMQVLRPAPFFFILSLLLGVSTAAAFKGADKGVLDGIHGNREILPRSCQACHRGMSMKISGEEKSCLSCHGNAPDRQEMVKKGFLKSREGNDLADIGLQLQKPYRHPVLTISGVHGHNETLPEEVANAPRHAECSDCHHPHAVDSGKPFRGLTGKRVGNFVAEIDKEYQLCYRCHAESANLPGTSTNKHAEFRTTNPSFHPVEGEGRSTFVISLREPYAARKQRTGDVSEITCADCHGNDEAAGPKGPHGSNYRGLVVLHYEMEDERPESEFAYALCYKCHNRSSILGNESFPHHARHIEGNRAAGRPGTSCFTCHDAHGSTRYPFLIRFNEEVVRPNRDGKIEFRPEGVATRRGSCLLSCHGVEHSPMSY